MNPQTIDIRGTEVTIEFTGEKGPDAIVGHATHEVLADDLDAGIVTGPWDGEKITVSGKEYVLGQHDYDPDGDTVTCTADIYEVDDGEEELYVNDEGFGNESYVGTWDEWRTQMEPIFRDWYKEYTDHIADQLRHMEIDKEDATPMEYEAWVEMFMDEHLSPATDDDVAFYDRLTD